MHFSSVFKGKESLFLLLLMTEYRSLGLIHMTDLSIGKIYCESVKENPRRYPRICAVDFDFICGGFHCGHGCGLAPFNGANLRPVYWRSFRSGIHAETVSISLSFFIFKYIFKYILKSAPQKNVCCSSQYELWHKWCDEGLKITIWGWKPSMTPYSPTGTKETCLEWICFTQ